MSNEDTNVKAEGGAAGGEHIVIRVRDQTGEEVRPTHEPPTHPPTHPPHPPHQ